MAATVGAEPEPGARDSIHVDAGAQVLGPSSAATQAGFRELEGKWNIRDSNQS